MFRDTAYRKRRAAQARQAGTAKDQEKPRDVYLGACASLGSYLTSRGFKYARSRQRARKESGSFRFEISFSSSHHNVAGEHVCLWAYAGVYSEALRRWRESRPFSRSTDVVAAGQIGNLQPQPCWLEWELADPVRRDDALRDVIGTIEAVAFPYFARFEHLPGVVQALAAGSMPGIGFCIAGVIEFLMCFADARLARNAGVAFLCGHPKLIPGYRRAFQRYAERGLSWRSASGTADLALLSHALEFGDLTEGLAQALPADPRDDSGHE